MILEVGQQLAHFKILRKLGEGGMGEVYLAEDTKLHRRVALKILLAEFLENEDRRARFEREARTAAQINHANVMSIYDTDTAEHQESGQRLTYIVMEHVEGKPLAEYLHQHHPNISELLRLAQRVASGLSAAHKLNIVHRDIKSENILITDQGEPKILDFGLAKPVDAIFGQSPQPDSTNTVSQELTQEGKILGTVSYMSPEQARGEAVDIRSDVFAFGILVYKMFTGASPFEAADRVSTLAKILEGRPTPLRQINAAAPAELERIVDKCLQKNPNDRYQDSRDLVVDLRSLRKQYDSGVSDSTSLSTEMPAMQTGRPSLFKRPAFWISVAAAVILIPVAIIITAIVSFSPDGPGSADATNDPEKFARDLQQQISRTLSDAGIEVNNAALQIPGVAAVTNALAILGFENKTNDGELDWLSAGLPEILLTDLAQGGTVDIISRSRVLDCLRGGSSEQSTPETHQACVKAARSLGASRVLSGSYFKMGDKIRIDARLEDTRTGQIVMAEKVIGDDPFVLVDSLTNKIAESLDLAAVMKGGTDVASITSSSPEAYKHYILGMEEFSVFNFKESEQHFLKAIEIDSTFALPYMRLAMRYAMSSRQQEGAAYMEKAMRYQDKLPAKDKILLGIYADIWLHRQYDEAMIKLGEFVKEYPDDKEVRTIYGIVLHQLGRDTEAGLAQLDTVMMLDPKFYWALEFFDQIYRSGEDWPNVIEVNQRMKKYYPDNLQPYQNLASVYEDLGRYDEAIGECQAILDTEPGNRSALTILQRIAIKRRDFAQARRYAEDMKKHHGDEPHAMVSIEGGLGNIDFWQGRFKQGLEHYFQALDYAKQTNDSTLIYNAYNMISVRYQVLGVPDSALYYSERGYEWSANFQAFMHANMLVDLDRANCPAARRIFSQAYNDFKSRVPQQMWSLVEDLQGVFEGYCSADTAAIIESLSSLLASQPGNNDDRAELGQLMVLAGRYKEGKEVMESIMSGKDETSNAIRFLGAVYYAGVAETELGNRQSAIEHFEELLKYWGNADIQVEEIVDARRRLAELTS